VAGVVLDIRDHRRSELETNRMRDLADASVEGLLVCDGDVIVSVNTSFSILTGLSTADLAGRTLESCFPDELALATLLSQPNRAVETDLRQLDGSLTPVELILRPIVFCRTAASGRRGSRPESAQGCRRTYLLPGASRFAHRASQPQPFQHADRPGDRGDDPG